MSDMQISQVLAQMRALAQQAGPVEPLQNAQNVQNAQNGPNATVGSEFANLLQQSLGQVSGLQSESRNLATAFEAGDPNVSLVDVMVAAQKSSVAFDAVVQVRNRLLNAYEEVMRMPV